MPRRILLVCSGNTCRSPMAAALFTRMLEERLGPAASAVRVTSAGTSAVQGVGPSVQAVMVLAERGIDLSAHKARAVSRELLDEHDLILTMTRQHKELLEEVAPEASGRVFTLKEYARRLGAGADEPAGPDDAGLDIQDPFGGAFEAYQVTARELEDALEAVADAVAAEIRAGGAGDEPARGAPGDQPPDADETDAEDPDADETDADSVLPTGSD